MKLLEVEKVNEENKQSSRDRIQRISKLNDEESASVKRINLLRESEKKEKELVQSRLVEVRKDVEIEKRNIRQEISSLGKEVDGLEKRKVEALKPINEIQKEAEDLLKNAKSQQSENKKDRKQIDSDREDLVEKTEALVERENDILYRDTESKRKHNLALAEEKRLKDSTDELSKKWSEFHKAVHKSNTEMTSREKEVEDGRRTNENFKKSLDKKEIEQAEHDRQIADRYGTLGRAIEEARNKHGINL